MPLINLETTFNALVEALMAEVKPTEAFTLTLLGEHSQFIRFNRAKVRQTGLVTDGELRLTLIQDQRTSYRILPFTGNQQADWSTIQTALADLRQEVPQLPVDPYLVTPSGESTSRESHPGCLLAPETAAAALLPGVEGLDFTGFYAGGLSVRAYADSIGQRHWFETETFNLDYSLFTADGKAVKGFFADSHWDDQAYVKNLQDSKTLLAKMEQPAKPVPKGQYRTYLAPAAVADLVSMFSWGGVSEASIQRGGSALGPLHRQEKKLSPQFHLKENFKYGATPRFNNLGEVAPVDIPLIVAGQLENTLISSRTAKEYGKVSNYAGPGESLRAPEVATGDLPTDKVLETLDTGLYVSNLHYLNWSDRPNGRITGMTRYACFWVDGGEIVAPIDNLRFDESLYRFFGDRLVSLTDSQLFIPEVGTYGHRSLGGIRTPGLLAEEFTYTL
ncbi:MAG: metallopeptidase TldD-related protein [Leptolyngbyaceae cyanobacterium MO_188.B28]|nr:metallopeptidase TldD-related protein [Leptolyngbyaceae cyanobacterium MO_188.B28]